MKSFISKQTMPFKVLVASLILGIVLLVIGISLISLTVPIAILKLSPLLILVGLILMALSIHKLEERKRK